MNIKYIELYADKSSNLIGDNLVRELIDRLFEEQNIKGYTFYSHNLSNLMDYF